jgi:hypothetical protein
MLHGEAAMRRGSYRESDAHEEIKRHGARLETRQEPLVKEYALV